MNDELHVIFEEDQSRCQMAVKDIARLCYDLKSWWQLLRLVNGVSDHAILTLTTTDRRTNQYFEMRAAAQTRPFTYDKKFEFPETA
jgi:hypothetical protein